MSGIVTQPTFTSSTPIQNPQKSEKAILAQKVNVVAKKVFSALVYPFKVTCMGLIKVVSVVLSGPVLLIKFLYSKCAIKKEIETPSERPMNPPAQTVESDIDPVLEFKEKMFPKIPEGDIKEDFRKLIALAEEFDAAEKGLISTPLASLYKKIDEMIQAIINKIEESNPDFALMSEMIEIFDRRYASLKMNIPQKVVNINTNNDEKKGGDIKTVLSHPVRLLARIPEGEIKESFKNLLSLVAIYEQFQANSQDLPLHKLYQSIQTSIASLENTITSLDQDTVFNLHLLEIIKTFKIQYPFRKVLENPM